MVCHRSAGRPCLKSIPGWVTAHDILRFCLFFFFFFLSSFFNLTFLLCSTKSTLNFLFYTYKQSDCKGWTTHPIIHIWTIIYCLHILIVKYPSNIFSTFYTVFLASDPLLVKLSAAIVVYSRTRNITDLHSSRAARNVNVAWLQKSHQKCVIMQQSSVTQLSC